MTQTKNKTTKATIEINLEEYREIFDKELKKFMKESYGVMHGKIDKAFTESAILSHIQNYSSELIREAARDAIKKSVTWTRIDELIQEEVTLAVMGEKPGAIKAFLKQHKALEGRVLNHKKVASRMAWNDLDFTEEGATVEVWNENRHGKKVDCEKLTFTWDELLRGE